MIKAISNNSTFISAMSQKKEENIKSENTEKSKVETIKESIQNGNYKIDLDKTAQKMAKSLL
jgi:anti-sigma28 factor (negative regulator of flagellin synthesis)